MKLLLADDLTGSCDAGIKFVCNGLPVSVAIGPDALPDMQLPAEGLAVNADTRGLTSNQAYAVTADICSSIQKKMRACPDLLYKKLDSTLRGNPGAEIRAIVDTLGSACALVAVASPDMGRTVSGGILKVDGVALAETVFALDPGSPMRESEVLKILGEHMPGAIHIGQAAIGSDPCALADMIQELHAGKPLFLVFDSVNQGDLEVIAQAGLSMDPAPVFAGSAGLAQALARQIPAIRQPDCPAKMQRVLFVCGSANRTTHEQIDAFKAAGFPVVSLDACSPESRIEDYAATVTDLLQRQSVCITVARKRLAEPAAISAQKNALAAITARVLYRISPGACGVFITGGETACGILNPVANCMRLQNELLPGIVAACLEDGPFRGLTVVTKAGGFGDKNTLLEILQILT